MADTIVNYSRLSWDGNKYRGEQVLKARTKVNTRVRGSIPGITAPVHVASLLEELIKHSKTLNWFSTMLKDLEIYRTMRQGVKVEKIKKEREKTEKVRDLVLSMAKGAE
jgi:hypothetical protein